MEQFAEFFKKQYPEIPEDHYGWLAKIGRKNSVKGAGACTKKPTYFKMATKL